MSLLTIQAVFLLQIYEKNTIKTKLKSNILMNYHLGVTNWPTLYKNRL